MSLNIKHAGVWQTASEVHIKQDGAWKKCTEVYINKDGSWKPMLYELATTTITTTGAGTITVPEGVFRASVLINGASGGKGGYDGGRTGGDGGKGATLLGSFDVTPFTVLSYIVATAGGDGATGSGNAGGAGGIGFAAGGAGGSTGVHGWSGSGGGGGGSSSISMPDTTIVMVAGGGSGGGGRGNRAHLSQSAITGKDSKLVQYLYGSIATGGDGQNCTTADGGAGGGGGGGASPIAPGGLYMGSYDSDGYPGEASTSYYDREKLQTYPALGTNTGNGSITITWLPE
jgi:hypothetical protein